MKKESKHLAVFIHGFSGAGSQRSVLTLVNTFAARGYKVDLVAVRSRGPLLQELSPLVRLVTLDPWWARLPLVSNLFRKALLSAPALASYLRRERPDVVLSAANPVNHVALSVWHLARIRTRLVVRVSNHLSQSAVNAQKRSPKRFRLWQARHLYPLADAIIAGSQGIATDIVRVTGLPRERITTIYDPVVTPELYQKVRAPLDHPWFAPDSSPVLLGVGRLVTQKDFPTLLRAFCRVRAVMPARLLILGKGRKRPELTVLARELGVAADVAMPGFVPNPFPYMAQAGALVLSSAWEGLPGVLIEAMACGCPVISTDCPSGPAEILEEGVYGPLVPVGDDTALAKAILSVLAAPPDPDRLRTRAAEFSVDRVVERYLAVLFGT